MSARASTLTGDQRRAITLARLKLRIGVIRDLAADVRPYDANLARSIEQVADDMLRQLDGLAR